MHEPVLVCTLGSPRHKPFPSAFEGVAREHSRKPEAFYDLVNLYAPELGPRADLFARTVRPGWDAWGNETEKFTAIAGESR
jgi:N6-adenosine-specific RNA methylase IME4